MPGAPEFIVANVFDSDAAVEVVIAPDEPVKKQHLTPVGEPPFERFAVERQRTVVDCVGFEK